MANLCDFTMRIVGEKALELANAIVPSKEGKNMGRVYDADIYENTLGAVELNGSCAWSVKSALTSDHDPEFCLESESKRLGLKVEFYASEPGCEFQEHGIIDCGVFKLDECINYEEYDVDEFDSVEELNEEYETKFTKEDFEAACPFIQVGGYGDSYGQFSI